MAIQFYRKPNDKNLYEVGTNRPISATEFGIGTPNAGRGFQEVTQQQNDSPTGQVQIPNKEAMGDYTNITSPKSGDPRLYGTPIQRDGADLKVAATGLDQWKNNTNLIEGARNIIQMKQGLNKDIQAAKQVWRDKATDNTTFEGQGQKQFTELSPAEQADIRSQRYTTAQSHIKGLREEEEYRGVRTEDILTSITDMLAEKDKLNKAELDKAEQMLNIAKKKQDLGLEVTAEDLGMDVSKGIGDKIGGSVSWRHNNPGNIKFGSFAEGYGATKGQGATDGGAFAVFPDLETGQKAMGDLLNGKNYLVNKKTGKDMTVEEAMKRWSNNGYGAEVLGYRMPGMLMKDLVNDPKMLNDLITGMVKREGWSEGTTLQSTEPGVEVTNAKKYSLMEKWGLSDADVKGWTNNEWLNQDRILTNATIKQADIDIKEMLIQEQYKSNTNLLITMIKAEYKGLLSNEQIELLLSQNNIARTASMFEPTYTYTEQ